MWKKIRHDFLLVYFLHHKTLWFLTGPCRWVFFFFLNKSWHMVLINLRPSKAEIRFLFLLKRVVTRSCYQLPVCLTLFYLLSFFFCQCTRRRDQTVMQFVSACVNETWRVALIKVKSQLFFFLFESINSLSFLFPVFKLSGFFEKGENVAYTFQNKAPCIHTALHIVAARGQTCSEVSDVPSLRSLTCSPETFVLQIKLLLLCVCVCGRKGWTPFHTSGGGSETVTSSAWHFHMSRGWGCERFLCQSVFSHTEVHFSVLTFSLLSPVSLM